MEKQITPKSTKNEILSAYNELITRIKEQKADNPKTVAEQEKKQEIVKKASENSYDNIVKNMSSLKLNLGKYFEELETQLIVESKKLSQIKEAITIEEQNLEDIYGIKANADSLAALLQAQKEKKETFELELTEKKKVAEENAKSQEVTRKREEDEFQYALKISRKKEQDAYDEKKAKLEKDLIEKKTAFDKDIAEREAILKAQETEFQELKKEVSGFPDKLEATVKNAKKELQTELETRFKFESSIASKDTEAELKLKDQKIANLETKIEEQQKLIADLTQKANDANNQVQSIAVKAIENASKSQVIFKEKEGNIS